MVQKLERKEEIKQKIVDYIEQIFKLDFCTYLISRYLISRELREKLKIKWELKPENMKKK